MKKFVLGVAVLLIGLGFIAFGAINVHAQELTPAATPSVLSQKDAATLKQSLDILKQTLDLLALIIQQTPAPIANADSINSELSGLKTSLISINSTLVAMSQTPSSNVSVEPSGSNEPVPVNNQLASVSSTFHWNYVTWPVIAVIAAIVLTLVIRRKIAGKKLIVIKENIKEMKGKSA